MTTETPLRDTRFFREIPRQKYYTPDGRVVYSIPNMHGTKDGGVRDANLDKGWLMQPPQSPKLRCPHCDRWHDTKPEITRCGMKRKAFYAKLGRDGKKELKGEQDGRIAKLESEIAEIKGLLIKALEAKK